AKSAWIKALTSTSEHAGK
ncbi:hypothetical protein VCHENC02_5800B, partial [Vibrio harveyi]